MSDVGTPGHLDTGLSALGEAVRTLRQSSAAEPSPAALDLVRAHLDATRARFTLSAPTEETP